MEDIQQIIIPTLSREKISRNLSYPIGAERISSVLASAAQISMLKLHFYSGLDQGSRSGRYEFLHVEYLNNATPGKKWPISNLYNRPPQYRWEIVVQPVPRVFRHRIQQYIIDSALLQIAQWLIERTQLAQQGNDILAYFFNEATLEFTPHQLTHLEPLSAR